MSFGGLIHTLTDATDSVNSVAFSPDSKWLAAGEEDYKVYLYDVTNSFALTHTLTDAIDTVYSVAFSPDGRYLATGDVYDKFYIYSFPNYNCDHWCSAYTCDKAQCKECDVCAGVDSGRHCSPWCNVYSCWVRGVYCDGCDVCTSLKVDTHCASWWWVSRIPTSRQSPLH